MGDKINARRVLVRKPEGKRPLGRPRRRYEEPWLHSDIHIWGSFFLKPEDIRKLNIEAIWNFAKGSGLL